MSQINQEQQLPAITREFAAKLDNVGEKQPVRAMVMLQTGENGESSRRQSWQERQRMIEEVRQASRSSLPDIDRILALHDGKRLSEDVDALGSIIVETTPEGIKALANSDHVKAIFEDKSIFQHL